MPAGSGEREPVSAMRRPCGELRLARVYDDPSPRDGRRVLVDRLWPRGLSKEAAALDGWCKAIAPSQELRRWYGHDPDRYAEFSARYREELEDAEHAEALERIAEEARHGVITLLTATKELSLSHAAVIGGVIDDLG
jgi:uncharacterized protein YeaO (DUF488 family)